MKKALIFLFALVLILTGCSNSTDKYQATGDIVTPEINGKTPEITILAYGEDKFILDCKYLIEYKNQFEKNYGIRVNYEILGVGEGSEFGIDNYKKKLTTKLYTKNGPELILYDSRSVNLQSLIQQNAISEVRNNIPNISKIYSNLLNNEVYYVPVGIEYRPRVMNKKVLDKLKIQEPSLNWTRKDYSEIRKLWLYSGRRPFTRFEYYDICDENLSDISLFNKDNHRTNINTVQMKEAIKNIQNEIFSGNYSLNNEYTYENYYNMIFEPQSEEYRDNFSIWNSEEYTRNSLWDISYGSSYNLLRAKNINYATASGEMVILPRFSDENSYIESYGFLVNKNGKNKELAYEFLNGLLSNEIQLKIYQEDGFLFYPANKEIENTIANIESKEKLDDKAIALKNYVLQMITGGKCIMDTTVNEKDIALKNMVARDITKLIFADKKYTDEQISLELQELDNKYTMWLNE